MPSAALLERHIQYLCSEISRHVRIVGNDCYWLVQEKDRLELLLAEVRKREHA
jgi:hypothetical protein